MPITNLKKCLYLLNFTLYIVYTVTTCHDHVTYHVIMLISRNIVEKMLYCFKSRHIIIVRSMVNYYIYYVRREIAIIKLVFYHSIIIVFRL